MDKNYVPEWKLERYILGELSSRERKAIAALERTDDELRGRIAALRADDEEILAKYPPAEMAAKALDAIGAKRAALASGPGIAGVHASGGSRRQQGQRGIPRWAIPAFACAALLILLPVYILPILTAPGGDSPLVYEDRAKGTVAAGKPSLEVWRKAGNEAEMLAPEADARAGDIVQLRYIVPKPCYGLLVSMDGWGVLTVHLAGNNGKAVPLTAGRPVALDVAYQLDDAPGYEAFYLITAPDDFGLESVKEALLGASHPIGEGQSLSMPRKQLTAFTLRKSGVHGIF